MNIQIAENFNVLSDLDTEINYRQVVVKEKKELLYQFVGTLYPRIVRDQIINLNQEIETLVRRRVTVESICELNKEYLLKKWKE